MKGFYFDEHMHRAVAKALIERGHQVVMAVDVGMEGKDDDNDHLPYAIEHDLVTVTFDRPFAHRTMSRQDHPGLICLRDDLFHQIGTIIEILDEFVALYEPERDAGQVFWFP